MGKYTDRLFSVRDIYDTDGTRKLFLAAVRENCGFQYKHCKEYRKILDSFGFSPEKLKHFSDIEDLPFIPTAFLKKHRLFSMPQYMTPIRATSSGTSGNYSEIGMDLKSMINGLKMVMKVFSMRGIVSAKPCHYIVLGFRPGGKVRMAAAKTAFGYTFLAPAIDRLFAITQDRNGDLSADLEKVTGRIVRNSRSPFPTRFMGFPAYTYFTLRLMEERGISVKLPAGSSIMLGGGWKQFYKEKADKEELYRLAEKQLGISEDHIFESFGAAEHPILYCDCPAHHFHVPVFSRVIIRDVHTLKPVKNGETGLVELISPLISAVPVLSVLTDDLGILHDGKNCPCGITSPYLEIVGRVGLKEIKTCAAGAAELLGGAS